MIKPFQLWLSLFDYDCFDESFNRDLHNAKSLWRGEDRIWLLPWIDKERYWSKKNPTINELAVPSRHFNVISIINVDKNGHFYPERSTGIPRDWNKIPEQLYKKWLNISSPQLIPIEPNIRIAAVPDFKDGKINFRKMDINLKVRTDNSIIGIRIKESQEIYSLSWKPPFDEMFFMGGNGEILKHINEMNRCIKQRDYSTIDAWNNRFVDKGWAPLFKCDLLPRYCKNNAKDILEFVGQYYDLRGLKAEEKFKELYTTTIELPRIFGWIGYFWLELNQELEQTSHNSCELCGKILTGKSDKRFCGKEDNIECFRNRRKNDKRKERIKKVEIVNENL